MSSLLSVDRELGRLLSKAAGGGESGVVTAVRGKLKRLFCIEDGCLALAVSNVIEEQVAHLLLRAKRISTGDLRVAQEACERRKELKLSRVLVESGPLSAEQMERTIAEHVSQLLFATLDWTDGQCDFERGKPDLEAEFTIRANSVALMLDYARSRPKSIDHARMRVGSPNVQPIVAPEAEKLLDGIALTPPVQFLMAHCSGGRSLSRLVEESPHAPEETWRALYGLVLCGAVEARGAGKRVASTEGRVTREELLARVERASDANHYGVLELNTTASPEEVRETYYFLARRYHPDRLRASHLEDLQSQIESYFSQVTEAYNTLADPELRKAYDEDLKSATGSRKPEQDTRELAEQNYLLARTLIERGRYTDAVTSLENAIQLDAGQAKFYLELGRLQARNPRHRQAAENHLLRANEIDPTLIEGYYSLGDLYVRTDRTDEAIRLFKEVLRWEPGHLGATEQLEELGEKSKGGGKRGLFGG